MKRQGMSRRDFIKVTGTAVGASMLAGPGFAFAAAKPGAKVDSMKLMTTTATFDPVRPESARLIAQAFKQLGWDVQHYPIDYKQNVQKVIMEHDYDMWLVRFTGASLRIDPNVFIYKVHHSSNYRKGGYNWTGYSNPEVDKLAAAQQTEMDINKRQGLVYKAQEIIHEQQPENALVNAAMTNAYRSDRLRNLTPQMGEGIGSFWTDINMEVIKGDGYVRTGVNAALKNLNPVDVKDGKEFKELRMIYDRLFRINPDGQAKPWMVESYSIPEPTTINLTLRKGMLWHDGKPVTAQDVKFSFDYMAKWKAPFFFKSLANVENLNIKGKHALTIKLKNPFAPFLANVLAAMFIIPQHIWKDIPEKVDVNDPLNFANEKPIGSGPFKFEHWDRGRELKLSAFKDHFNPPKCAGNILIVYGSHDAMAAAIEKDECDRTRYILKPSLMEDLNKVKGVAGKAYPSHGFYDLSYHTRRPPLNDPVFRKAIAHVLPKEMIRDAVLSGYATIGSSVMAPVNKFWHNPAVKPFPNDIKKAKKILSDAGYTWDSKGKLHYPKG